jgi:hypothetical protein
MRHTLMRCKPVRYIPMRCTPIRYTARSICSVHKDSEMCVGYFLVDIPGWARHQSAADLPGPDDLENREREANIGEVVRQYYKTICEAIKAIDSNHLILGDRFNGNKGIPEGVLDAMKDQVDVLSVQYFCEPRKESRLRMVEDLKGWSEWCGGKPVLVADIGNWCATEMNPQRKSGLRSQKERAKDYVGVWEAPSRPAMVSWLALVRVH